ncbi:MAG: deoxyhypusine synthase [Candidatus Aenigmarchaeota archaeon]|nr:deoxyhypusine synthase [Candidatus Aenigmarchaeota archaeon]
MRVVKDIEIKKTISVNELVKEMEASGGFTAKNLGIAVNILERMIKDKSCLKFFSFPACIVSTGTRGIIKHLVEQKLFDVLVTTCGTLDHDVARVYKKYYHGSFLMDDKELHRRGVHRLGNILVPKESYGIIIEKEMTKFLNDIFKKGNRELSTYELCWEIGKRLKSKESILYWCWKNEIPVIVPGITDGAVGYQIWQFSQDHQFKIDVLKDEQLMSDLVWNAKKTGALIVGGGISKHHTIWHSQFKGGLDYAVYITTAKEYDGSLSGARTHEAISWGKIKEEAKHITVDGDATVYLPIIYATLLERLSR